jgi:3-oxoacyl-[acyl-carrier-protein] synthase-1
MTTTPRDEPSMPGDAAGTVTAPSGVSSHAPMPVRPMRPLAIVHATAASALGIGRAAHAQALRDGRTGLRPEPWETVELPTWIGRVDAIEQHTLPASLAAWDCRNNRLAHLGLLADDFAAAATKAAQRWGAHRVGVFVGTSTSGILQTELAYRARDAATGALPAWFDYARTHNTYSVAGFVREALRLQGPAFVVSTACSSGAKVFANAQRAIDAGVIDAAVVGGVDSLCLTTLYGFNSLELLSSDIARPFDAKRNGLSVGEAAAFALVERDVADAPAWLLGAGETSDGHHMSAPHPDGLGAAMAMRQALQRAGLEPNDIDYVNLHGTATPSNDAAEDQALASVFGVRDEGGAGGVPCSSTKGATGHTLGAAGALEALVALLALEHPFVPGGLNRREPDPALRATYVDHGASETARRTPLRHVMSNSFGFGGSNASLVFGAHAATAAVGGPRG